MIFAIDTLGVSMTAQAKEKFMEDFRKLVTKYKHEYFKEGCIQYIDSIWGIKETFKTEYPKAIVICKPAEKEMVIAEFNEIKKKLDAAVIKAVEKECLNFGHPFDTSQVKLPKVTLKSIESDDVRVSISKAYKSFGLEGRQIKKMVEEYVRSGIEVYNKKCQGEMGGIYHGYVRTPEEIMLDVEDIRDEIEAGRIKDEGMYQAHHYTGKSYRITAFDVAQEKRIQLSLGNLLVVVSEHPEYVVIRTGAPRKERNDKDIRYISRLNDILIFEHK